MRCKEHDGYIDDLININNLLDLAKGRNFFEPLKVECYDALSQDIKTSNQMSTQTHNVKFILHSFINYTQFLVQQRVASLNFLFLPLTMTD